MKIVVKCCHLDDDFPIGRFHVFHMSSIYFLNNSIEHETHRCHISQIPENDFPLKSSFIQINWN